MDAAVDHVFVMCAPGAPEAEALARLGLREGSPNTHPGQGTACRRFFFRNAYLELLWVTDPAEAQREPAASTRLYERWSARQSLACPFGIVSRGAGPPPFESWPYQAPYFPPGFAIDVAAGTTLAEPALFHIRGARRPDQVGREPVEHALGVLELSALRVGLPAEGPRSAAVQAVEAAGLATLVPSASFLMELELQGAARQGQADLRPGLPLVLRW